MNVRACRQCGCTETSACMTAIGPCTWVEKDLCSACAGVVELEDQHRNGVVRLLADTEGNFAAAFWTGDMWAYAVPPGGTVQQIDFEPSHFVQIPAPAATDASV